MTLYPYTTQVNKYRQVSTALHNNIGKVRIHSVFDKLLQPPTQLELPQSSIPLPKGAPFLLSLSKKKTINTSHLLDLHLK